MSYELPDVEKRCGECKYREYDSFHGEIWCSHKPKPDGMPESRLIDSFGTCEYWEQFK